jgi:KDO2-lipid IV(A) lauroyltransferase
MNGRLSITDKIRLFPLWLLTLLPLRILYVLSDALAFIVYSLLRYRRKVVRENLINAFPQKKESELKKLEYRFYRYLTDYFIESIYLMNMSLDECDKRYQYQNIELLSELYQKNRDIILATSHYGNWEWAVNLTKHMGFSLLGIYKPLSNKLFDRLFIHLRGKFGGIPVTMKHTLRTLVSQRANGERFALYTVGDQRPVREDLNTWISFLNQETPIITGWERIARKFDLAVVFIDINRVRRGYYSVEFRLITENPNELPVNSIAERYMHEVEAMVVREPEYYLWSHKRWKYRSADYKPMYSV